MAPTYHPRSLDELTELSRPTTYDPGRTFKDQLRAIDALRNQSIHHKEKNDLENAYIYMAQAAVIMLEKLPHHSQYDILTPRQKKDLASNGANMLKLLEELKPQLQERYKKYKEGLANGVIIPSRKRKEDKSKVTYSFEERAQYPRTPNSIGENALRVQPSANSTTGVIIPLSESQERERRGVERSSRSPSRDPRSSSGHRIPTPSPTPSREPPSTLTARSRRLNEPADVRNRRESSDEENRQGDLLQAMRRMQRKFDADLEARLTDPAPLSESARRRQALEVVENTGIAERLWIEEKDRRLNGGRRSSTCERELRDQATLQGEREAHVNRLFDDRARRIEAREREAEVERQRHQEVNARIARELSKRAEEQLKAEQNAAARARAEAQAKAEAEAQAKADAVARAEARTQVEEKDRQRRNEELQARTSREWDEQRMSHDVSEIHRNSSLDRPQQPHQPQPPILRPPLPSNPPQSNNHSANAGSLINVDRALRRAETHGPTSMSIHPPQPVVREQSAPIIPIVPSLTPIIPSYPVTPTSTEHPPSTSGSHDHIDSRVHAPPLNIPQARPPNRYDSLPLGLGPLPLESPTRPRGSFQGSLEELRNPNREVRQRSYPSPITTTSPPPRELLPFLNNPPNLMSSHQRSQGYAPSPDSMFAPQSPQQDGTPNALLFQPIGVTEVPSKPDAHLGVVPWPNQPPRSRGPSPVPGFASMRNSPYPDSNGGPLQLPTSSHYPSGPGHSRPNSIVTPGQLRKVALPTSTLLRFLSVAALNTSQKRETCGLLLGRLSRGGFEISTLLIPKQTATENTCSMTNEELVAEIQEKRGLMTLGWIHTHPTQSCFMSSLDLHTHSGFQSSLPEAVAIVCAPNHTPSVGIFRLTDPLGLRIVLSCTEKAPFHPHSDSQPIYTDAVSDHVQMIEDARLEIIDLR